MTTERRANSVAFGPGFHTLPGRAVDADAYHAWVGRWSRLFVGDALEAAQVRRESRTLATDSFDEYWDPIDAGTGSLPQAYLAVPVATRQEVREAVRAHLSKFESDGRLVMTLEMLIPAGRA
jgi:hypothetical protein